jgi:hypothetical protein
VSAPNTYHFEAAFFLTLFVTFGFSATEDEVYRRARQDPRSFRAGGPQHERAECCILPCEKAVPIDEEEFSAASLPHHRQSESTGGLLMGIVA